MNKLSLFFIIAICLTCKGTSLNGLCLEERKSLCVIGGGYLDTRKYPGSCIQLEYKYGNYIWRQLRPQATFLLSQFYSGFIGFGFGWEFYLSKQIVVIPSFCPGIYWKGKGRNLGYPLEFQSAIEIAYEMDNQARIGIQISHVSNAHLSPRNPGFNAFTIRFAIPLNINN